MLKAKLYAGNIRVKRITYKEIDFQEEYSQVEAGQSISVGYNLSKRY